MAATIVVQKALYNSGDNLRYGTTPANRYTSYINVSSVGFKNPARTWVAGTDAAKGSLDASVAGIDDVSDVSSYPIRRPVSGGASTYSMCCPIRFTVKADHGVTGGVSSSAGSSCSNFKVWLADAGANGKKPYIYDTSSGTAQVQLVYKVLGAGESLADQTSWTTPTGTSALHDSAGVTLGGTVRDTPTTGGDYLASGDCGATQWLLIWQEVKDTAPIGAVGAPTSTMNGGLSTVGSTTIVYSYDES